MTYTDHKTFWLLIAVMIGVPSLLFVVALLKATTKDPFGVSGAAARHRPPSGQMLAGISGQAGCGSPTRSEGQNKLAISQSQRRSGSPRPTHTIQFSAVPVLNDAVRAVKATGRHQPAMPTAKRKESTADTKANPPRPQGCKGILAATEPRAVRPAQAHADRLSDFQLEGVLKRVR